MLMEAWRLRSRPRLAAGDGPRVRVPVLRMHFGGSKRSPTL